MRVDLWLWLAGAAILLIGGLLRLWPCRGKPARFLRPLVVVAPPLAAGLGLACGIAGLIWRSVVWGAWPGSTPADALALLASGSLVASAGNLIAERSGGDLQGRFLSRRHALSEALALFGVCLLLLLATALAWAAAARTSLPGTPWLLWLWSVLAGIGLGGWLPALADHLSSLRPKEGRKDEGQRCTGPGPQAMRLGYPALTAAWLVGVAWSVMGYAVPWRGLPAELWLLVAWLLGGVYLCATWSPSPPEAGVRSARLPGWVLALLAAFGSGAAVLAAWWMPLQP